MIRKILLTAACLIGLSLSAQAQTTSTTLGLAAGANPRNLVVQDDLGSFTTIIGSVDHTTHNFNYVLSGTTLQNTAPGLSINLGNANTWTATQTFPAGSILDTKLQTQATNTVLGNFGAGTASPAANTMAACATNLTYVTNTGFVCGGVNSIPLTQIAQEAANTIVGNFTAGTANATANTINGGSSCATALTYTNGTGIGCATGAVTSITSSAGLASTVNPITTSGTIYLNQNAYPSGGRLTLTSGAPVMTANVAAATSILWTPYMSTNIQMSNPQTANDSISGCGEVSNVLANAATGSAGPAAVVASGVYDMFMWNNAGTLASPACTLTRGPAWTNSTTRSAGTALSRTNGILRNSVAITNGPGIGLGTYVGTFVADGGGGTVSWNTGGAASGGTAATLNVWNMYNRVGAIGNVTDNGANYNYQNATTRQARASTGNQVSLVVGQQEEIARCSYTNSQSISAVAGGGSLQLGCGLNSTTTFMPGLFISSEPLATSVVGGASTSVAQPAIGVNTFSANEATEAASATSMDVGSLNNLNVQMRM